MPFTIVEGSRPDQIVVIVSGDVSVQEMEQFMTVHRGGPERHSAFLFDVSAASINVAAGDVLLVASKGAREERKSPMGPVAFISSNPGPFGLARMFQAYSSAEGRRAVGVFRTLAEAQAWLSDPNGRRSAS